MNINHAILHVLDFVSCVNVYARQELDLSSKNAKRYVTDMRGAFSTTSTQSAASSPRTACSPRSCARSSAASDFIDLSVQIAEFIAESSAAWENGVDRRARH